LPHLLTYPIFYSSFVQESGRFLLLTWDLAHLMGSWCVKEGVALSLEKVNGTAV